MARSILPLHSEFTRLFVTRDCLALRLRGCPQTRIAAPLALALHPEFTALECPVSCCVCHSLEPDAFAPPFFCFFPELASLGQFA